MVSVVKWYLAVLSGIVLNMEKSEKSFGVFSSSLLIKVALGDS